MRTKGGERESLKGEQEGKKGERVSGEFRRR